MNADTIVARGQDHVEATADGELVLMHVETGRFFALSGSGLRIWQMLEAPTSLGTLVDQLTREYEVAPDQCLKDVTALCEQMAEGGLIDVAR